MVKSLTNLVPWCSNYQGQLTVWTSSSYNNHNPRQVNLIFDFNNNSISWHYDISITDYSNPVYQLNYDNWTYYYFALN